MSERIKVFMQFAEDGTILCLCKKGRKKCDNWCEAHVVYFDRWQDWRGTYNYSKYGKSIESEKEEGGRRYEPKE